jgi:molybdate transport system substrate-binding protein
VAALLVAGQGVGACGSGGSAEPTVITVSAASSLTAAFERIAAQFESANPGVTVRLNFGGSSALAEQIRQGAPVDVFASASITTAEDIADLLGPRAEFARNFVQIAVPATNAAGITSAADLATPGVSVATCQEQVPCGAAARPLLAALDVTPVTVEPDVKSVLGKVIADEVDAGIVYVTDVIAAGSSVTGVAIPAKFNPGTTYPIAKVNASTSPVAQAFIDAVLSESGQEALGDYGFARAG